MRAINEGMLTFNFFLHLLIHTHPHTVRAKHATDDSIYQVPLHHGQECRQFSPVKSFCKEDSQDFLFYIQKRRKKRHFSRFLSKFTCLFVQTRPGYVQSPPGLLQSPGQMCVYVCVSVFVFVFVRVCVCVFVCVHNAILQCVYHM